MSISQKEREILRDLAKQQLELSKSEKNKELQRLWYLHNDLKGERPMATFEIWTCMQEFMPPLLCESEEARGMEYALRNAMLNAVEVQDDTVVRDHYTVGWDIQWKLFDLDVKRDTAAEGLGYHFQSPVTDIVEDSAIFKESTFSFSKENTLREIDMVSETIGDILPVKLSGGGLYAVPAFHLIEMMGMETMMLQMFDHPEEFAALVNRICDDYIAYYDLMEKNGLLLLNNGNTGINMGTYGFTNNLPKDGFDEAHIRTTDLWGHMNSQETVGISPGMFGEFFAQPYKRITEKFGLLSYGCCEPVDYIWEYIKEMPNLRKVSISRWCDENFMGERLQNSSCIFHRKPDPNMVGVEVNFDEDAYRKNIRTTLEAAKGCKVEFSYRDVYALPGGKEKARRAIQLIHEESVKHWK